MLKLLKNSLWSDTVGVAPSQFTSLSASQPIMFIIYSITPFRMLHVL